MEAEHAAHMAELKRQLDVEREISAQLVDSAVKGVQDSYGTIASDNEWKGAGRWTPPEVPVKTDVYLSRTIFISFWYFYMRVIISIKSFTIGNFVEITIKPFKRS